MAITNQQIIDFLLTNPGMSDADLVKAMETYGISPAQMASAAGLDQGEITSRVAATVPYGQAVLLGDTWVQPNYQVTGSGEDQQIGGIESVSVYKATGGINDQVATGTQIQNYSPTGEFVGTGQTQKVDNLVKEFLLGSAGLFGGAALAGLGGGAGAATVGTTGLTMAELAQLDLALGGAGGTAGATSLASALTTGAAIPTISSLTGGSGLLTSAPITAETVAAKLATDAELLNAGAGAFTPTTLTPVNTTPLITPTPIVPPVGTPPVAPPVAPPVTPTVPPVAPPVTPSGLPVVPPVSPTSVIPPVIPSVIPPAITSLIPTAISSLLTPTNIGNLLTSGATTAAGLLQQQTSKEAATKAQAMIDRETAAAKAAAQFRPIGMTTRFGSSQFVTDPITGRLTSAGYTLSPEAKAQQDRLVALSNAGLTQAEAAQTQFAPLQTGAQKLFGLGQGYLNAQTDPRLAQIASQYLSQSPQSQRLTALGGDYLTQSPESKMLTALGSKYIAQSPEAVAQNYLNQQMALLQPGRETELANLQNRLQQQGRGGLSVAQGGTLGATTPELQALYNARAQQELQLAAGAQQAGQQQVQFGAGLVGTGQQLGIQGQQFGAGLIGSGQQLGIAGQQFGMDTLARQQALEQQRIGFGSGLFNQGAGLMGQYYAGQQAAYAPYTTALGGVQNLEALAQQPFQMGAALGQQSATAGFNVGRLGLQGAGQSVDLATGRAATTNPYSTLLSGVAANPAFANYVGSTFGSTPQASLTAGFTPAQIAATEAGYPSLYG